MYGFVNKMHSVKIVILLWHIEKLKAEVIKENELNRKMHHLESYGGIQSVSKWKDGT